MTRRSRDVLFRCCSAAAVLAAAFHAAAMVSPTITDLEYGPTYPMWRHVVFIVIDGSLAWLLLRRPWWLVWAYAGLTLHILNGHGRGAWRLWMEEGRVDWISVAVTLFAPAILVLLVIDRRERRR